MARRFLAALGLVYLGAFLSLWPQLDGLVGSRGMLPVRETLAAVEEVHGAARFLEFPTLCWWASSDTALDLLAGGGVLLSLLVVLGVARPVCLAGAWAVYLSLFTVGRDFLSFQWDTLLLETGFPAILLAPRTLPARAPVWLLRWLLFRLMFASGLVKLTSGDSSWTDLTALSYHWWTQPLPAWGGWQLAQLPLWVQKAACAGSLLVELVVPFLIFCGRRPRRVAFFAILALQAGIAFAGNYGFFNVLTAVLCLVLLDDPADPAPGRAPVASPSLGSRRSVLRTLRRGSRAPHEPVPPAGQTLAGEGPAPLPRRPVLLWVRRASLAPLLLLSCVVFAHGLRVAVPAPVRSAAAAVDPFRLASP